MASIVLVEDEKHLADGLAFNLKAEGHTVTVFAEGEPALKLLRSAEGATVDAMILDVMLPGKNGFEIAAELRKAGQFVPILMLTARGRPEDVLEGFAAGADDYLPKPFDLSILMARLSGLLRRRQWAQKAALPEKNGGKKDNGKDSVKDSSKQPQSFQFSGRTVRFSELELQVGNKKYPLTVMETELLRYLIQNAGKAVSRKAILEDVWDLHEDTDTRAIDNFIVRLRRYIERDPTKPRHLLTVRGLGYRFVADPKK
jgi:DNA-binding response OmpR family regulator